MRFPWLSTATGPDNAVRRDDVLARARRNDRIYLGIAIVAILSFGFAIARML